jgi:SAM-dependent methyltransferase
MSVDVLNCPLCGSAQSSPFDRRIFRGQLVSNQLCTGCGLVYQSPRKSDEELSGFYEQEYRQLYQGSSGPGGKDLAVQRLRAEVLFSFAQDQISKVDHYLDIGCSAGLLMQRFKLGYGCPTVGVEPGEAYRSYARQQGLTIFATLDDLIASDPPKFDLVSMAHVLEHIPDPVEYLLHLHEDLLAANGWLLIEVPNLYAHDCFEIAHLVSYSPHTLTQTLQKSGFEVVTLLQQGQPRSRIIPLYLTALARPVPSRQGKAYPENYKPSAERAVRRKRKWGLFHRRLVTRLFPLQAWLPIPSS